MSDEKADTPVSSGADKDKKKPMAIIGSTIGFLALVAAFLSPWIADAIDPPPPPPQQQSIVGFAITIGKAVQDGTPAQLPPRQKLPSDFLPPAVIGIGLIGAGFGFLSFFMHEPWRFSACAVSLGVGAAVVQWSIIIVAAVLGLLLLGLILSALGIDISPG